MEMLPGGSGEPSAKRPRPDEEGGEHPPRGDDREMLRRFLQVLNKEQLMDILVDIGTKSSVAYDEIIRVAGEDLSNRKLFVRGISFNSTNESLAQAFSEFGAVQEATIIIDKMSGKSKGFGFVIFATAKAAYDALQYGTLNIDGRSVQFNLAAVGRPDQGGQAPMSGGGAGGPPSMGSGQGGMGVAPPAGGGGGGGGGGNDLSQRKLFVRGLCFETDDAQLREAFEVYGPVDDASVIHDRDTQKSKGFGFVTFRNAADARSALQQPQKQIGSRMTTCNLASEGPQRGGGQGMGAYGAGRAGFGAAGFGAGRGMQGISPAAMGMMAAQGFSGYGAYTGAMGYVDPTYGSYYGGPPSI